MLLPLPDTCQAENDNNRFIQMTVSPLSDGKHSTNEQLINSARVAGSHPLRQRAAHGHEAQGTLPPLQSLRGKDGKNVEATEKWQPCNIFLKAFFLSPSRLFFKMDIVKTDYKVTFLNRDVNNGNFIP